VRAGAATRTLAARDVAAHVRDLVALTKPGIVAMAVLQAAGGAALAPVAVSGAVLAAGLAGTGLLVAAAAALNMYVERDTDRLMARTADRPLPAGRLAPATALALGLTLGAAGAALLAGRVNLLTAGLGALALVLYVLAYTPLKRHTSLALLVGAVPGAMPPLMGWTAATGEVSGPGLALFAILFVWQVPHFLAIATYLKQDYADAGLRVVPLTRGDRATRVGIVVGTAALVPAAALLFLLGTAGRVYLALAVVLGVAFLGLGALGLRRGAGNQWARRCFLASLVYLPALTAALMIDGLLR
jgi:protoheme IX farnesyltransferase